MRRIRNLRANYGDIETYNTSFGFFFEFWRPFGQSTVGEVQDVSP
jgi:hypothetical protein